MNEAMARASRAKMRLTNLCEVLMLEARESRADGLTDLGEKLEGLAQELRQENFRLQHAAQHPNKTFPAGRWSAPPRDDARYNFTHGRGTR